MAGLVQGVALVTFPAASSIFTSPSPQGYGFSNTQYGAMFLPQVVLAILASSLAPAFARRWHLKRVFLLGLGSNLASMTLLALSNFFMASSSLAFGILLLATAALGLGFGTTVTAVNTYYYSCNYGRIGGKARTSVTLKEEEALYFLHYSLNKLYLQIRIRNL